MTSSSLAASSVLRRKVRADEIKDALSDVSGVGVRPQFYTVRLALIESQLSGFLETPKGHEHFF